MNKKGTPFSSLTWYQSDPRRNNEREELSVLREDNNGRNGIRESTARRRRCRGGGTPGRGGGRGSYVRGNTAQVTQAAVIAAAVQGTKKEGDDDFVHELTGNSTQPQGVESDDVQYHEPEMQEDSTMMHEENTDHTVVAEIVHEEETDHNVVTEEIPLGR
ncbi:hypothetical protein DY000_02047152 [Brassica cretica]|uniref:Uncharacterized protein n=1 Tax=Brassica cretica TaxID=69181 RepID=A0ABQ7F2R2_BRACR|nr:hypothetical protein DY000_02047152 [Brassica cretica]